MPGSTQHIEAIFLPVDVWGCVVCTRGIQQECSGRVLEKIFLAEEPRSEYGLCKFQLQDVKANSDLLSKLKVAMQ